VIQLPTWVGLLIAVIAVATALMAAVQVGVVLYAGRLARRIDRLAGQVEEEIKPLLVSLNAIGGDASRAASLALAQVERVDRALAEAGQRAERTMAAVQAALVTPAREGMAVVAALRAALGALRDLRQDARRRPAGVEDEDALFIG
jgi:hypothetical protein